MNFRMELEQRDSIKLTLFETLNTKKNTDEIRFDITSFFLLF